MALQQHMTHLIKKYERLLADYEQVHQMVMVIRSRMGGTCMPSFWRMVPRTTSLLLLQRRHCSSLIFICTIKIVMNIWRNIIQFYFYIFQFYTISFA